MYVDTAAILISFLDSWGDQFVSLLQFSGNQNLLLSPMLGVAHLLGKLDPLPAESPMTVHVRTQIIKLLSCISSESYYYKQSHTLCYVYRVAGLSCPEAGVCLSAILRGFPDVFSLFGPCKVGEISFRYSWTIGMK